ncbi:MAG: hypothetical protein AAFP19_02145 [Bacteroidota bacterium]
MAARFGIGIYEKKDYAEILRLCEDSLSMDDTWEEWRQSMKKSVKNFREIGIKTVEITVKPKELVDFCRARGLTINSQTRSNFIAHKVKELHED